MECWKKCESKEDIQYHYNGTVFYTVEKVNFTKIFNIFQYISVHHRYSIPIQTPFILNFSLIFFNLLKGVKLAEKMKIFTSKYFECSTCRSYDQQVEHIKVYLDINWLSVLFCLSLCQLAITNRIDFLAILCMFTRLNFTYKSGKQF